MHSQKEQTNIKNLNIDQEMSKANNENYKDNDISDKPPSLIINNNYSSRANKNPFQRIKNYENFDESSSENIENPNENTRKRNIERERNDKHKLNRVNGKYTFFGLSWKLIYYNLDRRRPIKTHAIIIEEDDSIIKIGITPDDTMKCFKVLKYLMKHMKNNKPFEPLFRDSEVESLKSGKEKID